MSPTSTGHPIPPAPKRIRKRKSPPQPRSGILAQPKAPAPAVEASRPSKAAPEAAEPALARSRTPRITVAALSAKIQALEAQITVQDAALRRAATRLDDVESHMAETIVGYEARIDSLEIKLAGAQRVIEELTAAAEVASVMSRPVAGTIKELGLIQAKAPAAPLESHKLKEQTMSQSAKETAVPSAVKAYANHLIWAAVVIASLLIWAVMGGNRGEAKYVTAKVNAAGMLMGQVEDGTWTFLGQVDRDSARRAEWQAGFRRGASYGYDSAAKRIHDSLARIPKPRKATMADFVETDAERARRLDSLARVQKLHDEGF